LKCTRVGGTAALLVLGTRSPDNVPVGWSTVSERVADVADLADMAGLAGLADIVVVGGGPAGTAAAITLARAGRRVVLVDKARFPRDKFCGDGLTVGALRLLEELGLRPVEVASWQSIDTVTVRSPSGRVVDFPLTADGGIYAAAARRFDLDAAVLAVARDAGAVVHDGHGCRAVRPARDFVTVDVEGIGEIRARYVIAADGMWSPVRKALGAAVAGYRGEWHAFRQYFCDVGPAAARRFVVWFEPDLLPGYAWSFPLPGNRANVGFGIQRDGGRVERVQDMARLWPDLLARPHIDAVLGPDARPEAPHRAWPIPARIDRLPLAVGRTLFVGDAAGATDPMTGEGIAQALETGMLAARAVVAAGPTRPDEAAARYRRDVARNLFTDHRMARRLSRVLRSPAGARGAIRLAGATDWTRRNFARWLMEDYPRAVMATPHRWHRRMFSGPGAYRPSPGPAQPG
jgi:geranylgeranyl reductase family protein